MLWLLAPIFYFPEMYDPDYLIDKPPFGWKDGPAARSGINIPESQRRLMENLTEILKTYLYPDGAFNMKPVDKEEFARLMGIEPNSPSIPHGVWIMAYHANLISIGLMRAAYLLGDNETFKIIRRWLKWYATHVQDDGAVHDYAGGSYPDYQDTGNYDSLDSYWATFAYDMWLYAVLTGDIDFVRKELYPAFERNTRAFLGIWSEDGLTSTKPHYPVKYSMDNSEVFLGLVAASRLEKLLGHEDRAEVFREMAHKNVNGIRDKLWVPGTYSFTVLLEEDNGLILNREIFYWYPDGFAQVMVASFTMPPTLENSRWFRDVFHLTEERDLKIESYPWDVFHLAWMAVVAWKFSLGDVEKRAYSSFVKKVKTPRGYLLPTWGWWLTYLTREYFGKDVWF